MLGSELTEDKCRVCGGDGTDCNTVSGVLDQKVRPNKINTGHEKKIHRIIFEWLRTIQMMMIFKRTMK